MHIVSHDGVVHVSPEDVTTRKMKYEWPGTFVLINLNVIDGISLEQLLAEVRASAQKEVDGASKVDNTDRYYVSIVNYFGKWAEPSVTKMFPGLMSRWMIDLACAA
jgi:hypothetical protein